MIILNSVVLEPCKQEYSNGTLLVTADIEYFIGSSETLDIDIDTYIINPIDGVELLVGENNIVNTHAATKEKIQITVTFTTNKNIDVLRDIINEFGNRAYTLVIKPKVPNSTWDGTKIISTAEVQLINVETAITVTEVTSSADNSEAIIKIDAKYWNNECMSLNATLSTDQDVYKLSMSYDSNNQLWNGVTTIIVPTGHCNQDITITLTGEYSTGCNPLPCTPWQYSENIKQTIKGPCMNTHFPAGLHTFVDTAYDDFTCSTILTSTSQHLVSSFMSHRNSEYSSVYAKVITKDGAMPQPVLIPDVTDYDQIDADLAPIAGTDDFVAVWSSTATSASQDYQISIRRFTVGAEGNIIPKGSSQVISQSNGDYMAPRIVYNKKLDLFFVTWAAVVDQEMKMGFYAWDNAASQFIQKGYLSTLDATVSENFFDTGFSLHEAVYTNACLVNAADKIIGAFTVDNTTVAFFEFGFANNQVLQNAMPEYQASSVGKFQIAFDDQTTTIKMVFSSNVSNSEYYSDIYGDTIQYFPTRKRSDYPVQPRAAIKINQSTFLGRRPFIKRTPHLTDQNDRQYVIAWECAESSVHTIKVSKNFIPMGAEGVLNNGDKTSDNVRIVITENQTCYLFNASALNGETLTSDAVLLAVE
ncbi:hypothetical protein XK97_14315 [Obesumbacterium proteus]|uniref:hypothetical protein n=1 Tax=Obesumbacterium proteus TaxID=82983 RepID=UPI00062133BE|nr:hypothetical protein [Obesumbacterium proteus]KKI44157.1 hypothetical protein XK97_14315 [Obesumbacterium proteus]